MPCAHACRSLGVKREVHLAPAARVETTLEDLVEILGCRPVIERRWWCESGQSKIDVDRVPLCGADTPSIGADRKALLVVGRYDSQELIF